MPRLETFQEVFPKFMIEIVVAAGPQPRPLLLLWDGSQSHIGPSVSLEGKPEAELDSRVYVPPELDSTIWQAIRLPSHAEDYESTRKVFDDICHLLKRFTGLEENSVRLAAHSVIASWFPDAAGTSHCLSIVGPRSGVGPQTFRVLSCLYRRPLVLGTCSLASFFSIPTELRASFFIDRNQAGSTEKLLSAVNVPGAYVPRKGRLVKLAFASVVYGEEATDFAGDRIDLFAPPVRERLPHLDLSAEEQIAREFQPKLLMYRLKNYSAVATSNFDAPDFFSSLRRCARYLGACVPDSADLQEEIPSLLSEQSEQAQTDFSADMNGAVIEALLSLCREPDKQKIHVGELASAVNHVLDERGELYRLTPRLMSNRLKALGLFTTRLDATGRGLSLHNGVRDRVTELARLYRLEENEKGTSEL